MDVESPVGSIATTVLKVCDLVSRALIAKFRFVIYFDFDLQVGTSMAANLTYCKEYGPYPYTDQYPCAYWDAEQAHFPADSPNRSVHRLFSCFSCLGVCACCLSHSRCVSVFLTTRFTLQNEQYVCSNIMQPCGTPWATVASTQQTFYVADIESFSVCFCVVVLFVCVVFLWAVVVLVVVVVVCMCLCV